MSMDEMKINKVQIRNLQIEDYDQLAQSFTRVYSDGSDVFWTHKQIEKLIHVCLVRLFLMIMYRRLYVRKV